SPSERAPDRPAWPAGPAPCGIQPSITIRGRGVRLVAALLAAKIPLTIPSGSRRLATAVLGAKALHAGPGLNQRSIDREVVVRQQRFDRGLVQHRGHELPGNVAPDQTLAVLGEH